MAWKQMPPGQILREGWVTPNPPGLDGPYLLLPRSKRAGVVLWRVHGWQTNAPGQIPKQELTHRLVWGVLGGSAINAKSTKS